MTQRAFTTEETASAPVNLVILFDNADRIALTALDNQLRPLVSAKFATVWHRDRINPGESTDTLFDSALEHAHIVVFIMSADFIASCSEALLARLEHWRASHIKIVSIVARPCMTDFSFKGVLSLPKDDSSIVENGRINEERLFTVVKALRLIIEEVAKRRDKRKTPMIDIAVMQTLARMEQERFQLERKLADKSSDTQSKSHTLLMPMRLVLQIAHLRGALGEKASPDSVEHETAAIQVIERAVSRIQALIRRERFLAGSCGFLIGVVVILASRIVLPPSTLQVAQPFPQYSLPTLSSSGVTTASVTSGLETTTSPTSSSEPSSDEVAPTETTTTASGVPAPIQSAKTPAKPCRREGQSCTTSYECCVRLKCNTDRSQCEERQ